MDIGIISARYAKALFAFASKNEEEDRVYKEMCRLRQALIDINPLRAALSNPTVTASQIRNILEKACQSEKKGNLSTSTRQFIAVAVKHRRTDMMSFIANSYISLYCKHKHIVKGKVILPIAANKDLLKRLQTFVQEQTRQAVDLELEVDRHIGGGFILQYDTYRYDASLRTRLDKLQRSLKV